VYQDNRINKPLSRKLKDLEDHLFILRGQLHGLKHDAAHIKVIAGILRVLVCISSGTEGLLWRLIEEIDVSDKIRLHVSGPLKRDHPLARGLRLSVIPLYRPDAYLEKHLPSQTWSVRYVIKSLPAVHALGNSYTHEQIIKMVAEQSGLAHEDDGVSPALATMEEIMFNSQASYFPVLRIIAEITLQLGERVIREAERLGIYERHRFSAPVSLSIHCILLQTPLVKVPVVKFESLIAEMSVEVLMMPKSFSFVVCREDTQSFEVNTPFPCDWKEGEDAAFCLTYNHKLDRAQAISPQIWGASKEHCGLGYVGASDFSKPCPHPECSRNIELRVAYVHQREFNPEEVAKLPELIIPPPMIQF
jgi:hypothetical protein